MFSLPWWMDCPVLTCLSGESTSFKKLVFILSSEAKVIIFCHVWCWYCHISLIFYYMRNNLDYWQRKDTMWVCSCVCAQINGSEWEEPSTKPHLSSWITDIINRRDSSISPVFPIQRWGAGLFPSLSANLMTFTKLLYVWTHTVMCLWMCVFLRMPITFYANMMLSVCIPVIIYTTLARVNGLLFLSGLMFYFCFAVIYNDNHADL